MDLVVDRLLPGDLDGALRLSTQAGWNQTAADWRRVLDLCPEGCLAGRLDGKLVATASIASLGSVRWIGMVLVDEALRGRGYGSTLLARAITLARVGGAAVGLDASDLGRPVYLKLGFHDVAPIDRWSGVLRDGGDSRDVGPVDSKNFDLIAALDLEATGIDRSSLLRSMIDDPEAICFAAYGNSLNGFAFLRPGRTCSHVGPVVAREGHYFEDLLGAIARTQGGSPLFLDALRADANTWMLKRAGLSVVRKLTRMTLGHPSEVLMGPMIRAAASFEWG